MAAVVAGQEGRPPVDFVREVDTYRVLKLRCWSRWPVAELSFLKTRSASGVCEVFFLLFVLY